MERPLRSVDVSEADKPVELEGHCRDYNRGYWDQEVFFLPVAARLCRFRLSPQSLYAPLRKPALIRVGSRSLPPRRVTRCSLTNNHLVKGLPHPGDKSVAATWNCHDVVVPVAAFAKYFPQVRDIRSQIALFNDRILPNPMHQIVFFHQLAVAFDERQESVELFRKEFDRLALLQKNDAESRQGGKARTHRRNDFARASRSKKFPEIPKPFSRLPRWVFSLASEALKNRLRTGFSDDGFGLKKTHTERFSRDGLGETSE